MSLQTVSNGMSTYKADTLDPQARVGLGLPSIDGLLGGGLRKGQMALVLAVSSVGKTTIGLQAIVANPQVPTVMFSIEMMWQQVVARLTTINSGTPEWELEQSIRNGVYPQQMLDTSAKFPLLLGNDSSEMPVKEMKNQVEEAGRRLGQPIRLVLVDYLELVGGAGLLGKAEQVDRAAVKILSLAKDTGTSVVLLHQVGKSDGGGGFKPLSLESGRYGGHQPAHVVFGAYAPRLNPDLKPQEREAVKEDLYLQVLKNRLTGRTDIDGVRLRLDSSTGKLSEWGRQSPVATAAYAAELSERSTDIYDLLEEF